VRDRRRVRPAGPAGVSGRDRWSTGRDDPETRCIHRRSTRLLLRRNEQTRREGPSHPLVRALTTRQSSRRHVRHHIPCLGEDGVFVASTLAEWQGPSFWRPQTLCAAAAATCLTARGGARSARAECGRCRRQAPDTRQVCSSHVCLLTACLMIARMLLSSSVCDRLLLETTATARGGYTCMLGEATMLDYSTHVNSR